MLARFLAYTDRLWAIGRIGVLALIVTGITIFPVFARQIPVAREEPGQVGNFGSWEQRIGVRVSPAIVRASLGRFLWFVDTRVGQVFVVNSGNVQASVDIVVRGIKQDDEGRLTFTPGSEEVIEAINVSHSSFLLAPGASRMISISLDSDYAKRRDRAGLCAAMEVLCSPSIASGARASFLASAGVNIPVLVRLPGVRGYDLSLEDVCTRVDDEDGATRVRIKVRNGGGAYVVASGVLSFEIPGTGRDGSGVRFGASDHKIAPGLVLPGSGRWLEAKIPQGILNAGDYSAEVRISVEGKLCLRSSLAVKADEFGSILSCSPKGSSPGRP
ncbi:MAG: hypothetical protein PHQ21_07490 [Firmicutes bacterium]|nr:hypothetical protein [Bacillota bacterium]